MSGQVESIILHTNHDSSPTWRVRIALTLKGLKFERKFYKFDELVSQAYLKVNPLGQIPAVEIDGDVITQSLAIIDYLEEKYPQPKLLPTDLKKRAKARQIAEIVNSGNVCVWGGAKLYYIIRRVMGGDQSHPHRVTLESQKGGRMGA
jgi:glutathione S-transferase